MPDSVSYGSGFSSGEIGTAKEQRYEKSIEDYSPVIKRNPEHSWAYYNRARVKWLLGKSKAKAGNTEAAQTLYHVAIIDSDKAINLSPKEAAFYYTRGTVTSGLFSFR